MEQCRVDSQIACMGDLGTDTARFFGGRAVFAAVWVVKSALYAFWLSTRQGSGRSGGGEGAGSIMAGAPEGAPH